MPNMSLSITSTVTLQSGKRMPLLGFGVYQSKQADSSVSSAIQSGYSHVDSARVYRNESLVCEAVHQAKQNGRVSDVWLTTKVSMVHPSRFCTIAHRYVDRSHAKNTVQQRRPLQ